jgi:large subunit ribosomal protein L3
VPGPEGSFVFLKDAHYKKPDRSRLPFPTFFIPEGEETENLEPVIADLGDDDPFMAGE